MKEHPDCDGRPKGVLSIRVGKSRFRVGKSNGGLLIHGSCVRLSSGTSRRRDANSGVQ